jgi:hypothetical protein
LFFAGEKDVPMKVFTVTAFFPEVKPAHSAWQTVTVPAGDLAVAATRALHAIRRRPGVAGKRISVVQLTIRDSGGKAE